MRFQRYIGHRKVTKEIVTKEGEDVPAIDFELIMSLVDLDEVVVAASFVNEKERKPLL